VAKALTHYVYALLVVGSSEICYVGRTSDPARRLYQHNYKRLRKGLPVVLLRVLISTRKKSKAIELEKKHVAKALAASIPILNQKYTRKESGQSAMSTSNGAAAIAAWQKTKQRATYRDRKSL
jgi:predicted GIY-YIG superfamily endonuclease